MTVYPMQGHRKREAVLRDLQTHTQASGKGLCSGGQQAGSAGVVLLATAGWQKVCLQY